MSPNPLAHSQFPRNANLKNDPERQKQLSPLPTYRIELESSGRVDVTLWTHDAAVKINSAYFEK
jgi:hypothetical protein